MTNWILVENSQKLISRVPALSPRSLSIAPTKGQFIKHAFRGVDDERLLGVISSWFLINFCIFLPVCLVVVVFLNLRYNLIIITLGVPFSNNSDNYWGLTQCTPSIAISLPTQQSCFFQPLPPYLLFFPSLFPPAPKKSGKKGVFVFRHNTTENQLIITFLIVQVDPTQNLTFNLKLTDDERQARSNLQLPYMYHEKKTSEVTVHPSGEGKVFYQPDEADDFDDEDPDDDLDI